MFLNRRTPVILALCLATLFFVGCKSKFEKLRTSNNITMKYQEAVKLYEKGKYSKALKVGYASDATDHQLTSLRAFALLHICSGSGMKI